MRVSIFFLLVLYAGGVYASTDLSSVLENVRVSCAGLSDELSEMKTMAGVGTAVTAVGSVAGGVALGTGIAKAQIDSEVAENEELIKALEEAGAIRVTSLDMFYSTFSKTLNDTGTVQGMQYAQQLKKKNSALEQKSKTLGDVRTGTLAASTATNIAGAIISGTNQIKGDLKSQVNKCVASVRNLASLRMQARLDGTVDDATLAHTEKIINACGAWDTVDVNSINNRSTGATVSSGIGAGLGLAGTITSGVANSEHVRSATGEGAQKKEKNLNTAANVLAGGTTVASVSATIFNATQISAIKRAVTVAEECEGALK